MEVLGQLNPSVMVDLDLDTQDFGRLGSLSTLFRTVGETLLHGNRQARVQCLQELAQQAPQALCSVALHVPFDELGISAHSDERQNIGISLALVFAM